MMSKAGVKFADVKELLLKDEEFKAEYEKLKPRYDVLSQILKQGPVRTLPRRNWGCEYTLV
jgi:hypothetical protein